MTYLGLDIDETILIQGFLAECPLSNIYKRWYNVILVTQNTCSHPIYYCIDK